MKVEKMSGLQPDLKPNINQGLNLVEILTLFQPQNINLLSIKSGFQQ